MPARSSMGVSIHSCPEQPLVQQLLLVGEGFLGLSLGGIAGLVFEGG